MTEAERQAAFEAEAWYDPFTEQQQADISISSDIPPSHMVVTADVHRNWSDEMDEVDQAKVLEDSIHEISMRRRSMTDKLLSHQKMQKSKRG